MAEGQFQPLKVPVDQLNGNLRADVSRPGATPVTVVQSADNWKIAVTWAITGDLVGSLSGTWHVQVIADELGGPETKHPAAPVAIPFTPGVGTYTTVIAMQSRLVAGTYDIVVNLRSTTGAGTPATSAASWR